MNTKKKYIAPALSLFMVQAEEGYAASKLIDLFVTDPETTNGQQNWDDGGEFGGGSWTWDD